MIIIIIIMLLFRTVVHQETCMHCICDMGYIFIAGANLIKFAYVLINNVYYVIIRNIMFNTNSQVTGVRYMY